MILKAALISKLAHQQIFKFAHQSEIDDFLKKMQFIIHLIKQFYQKNLLLTKIRIQ